MVYAENRIYCCKAVIKL